MRDFFPYLEQKSFLYQLGALMVLILVSSVIISILGLVLAVPFFGMDVLLNFNQGFDYTDKEKLAFLKYFQVVSQLGMFIVPAILFAYLYKRKITGFLQLSFPIQPYSLFISVLLILVSIPFVNYLVVWNEQMTLPGFMQGIEDWMRSMEDQAAVMTEAFLKVNSLGGLMINLLIIAVFAAIGEELLFRGVVLKILLSAVKNIHLAVIISAIIFSAFHGQFYGFIPRAVLGILFAYIFVFTGSLWIPIILHMLFNSVSVVVAYLFETGHITTNYEEFGESSSTWVIVASFVFMVAILGELWRRSVKSKDPPPIL